MRVVGFLAPDSKLCCVHTMNCYTDPKVSQAVPSYIKTWSKLGGSMREADGSLAE